MTVQTFTRDSYLTNLGRQRPTTNDWRADCKICRHGIYHGQPAIWLTQPMGLSHVACAAQQVTP